MSEIKDIITFNNNTKYSFYLISIALALACIIMLPRLNNIFKYLIEFIIIILLSITFYNLFSNTHQLYIKYPDIYISDNSRQILSSVIMSSLVIIVLGLLLGYICYLFVS